jgi:hypothetical protein
MHDELAARIEAMFAELHADGYAGKHDKVLEIIHATRTALTPAGGQLGPWEAEQLAYAEGAVRMNFLFLALNATEKAITVSLLPRGEYEYGFNYTKPKT